MARLVVNPRSPTAWEYQLKPGANFIGRGFANDFKLTDGSVSGSHCEIVVENSRVVIKDLGSTNGTYVNRAPVKEAVLQSGQTIHLGAVAMAFYADAPTAAAGSAQTAPPPVPIMAPRPVAVAASPAAAPRVASPATVVLAAPAAPVARVAPPTAVPVAPPPVAAPPVTAAPTTAVGSGPCRVHPRTPGRFHCSHCGLFFCELCVTLTDGGDPAVLPHLRHGVRAGAGAESSARRRRRVSSRGCPARSFIRFAAAGCWCCWSARLCSP